MDTFLGCYLSASRERSGLSQRALAEQIGVDYTYLSKIERGQMVPSDDVLRKLANALPVDFETMAGYATHLPDKFMEQYQNNPQLRKLFLALAQTPIQIHQIEQMIAIIQEA